MGGNPPQCTQRFHVCVPPAHVVDAKPCLSCDHWCHASSDDLLCPYHGQERGVLAHKRRRALHANRVTLPGAPASGKDFGRRGITNVLFH